MRAERAFDNELGRPIKITALVSSLGNAVGFAIKGPDSMTQSTLTRIEAEQLHSALGEVLANSSSAREDTQ